MKILKVWFKSIKKKILLSSMVKKYRSKKYPFWRVDTYFSNKKYNNIKFIENGGWHFTCIKSPKEVHQKIIIILTSSRL